MARQIQHLAIIPDGNGRWALNQNKSRLFGHRKGVEVIRRITRHVFKSGIPYLTLYTFSTENWRRSDHEISGLFRLMRFYLRTALQELVENNVCVKFIGEKNHLPDDVLQIISEVEEKTKDLSQFRLCLAFNYGGRSELVNACRKLLLSVQSGLKTMDDITEAELSKHTYTNDMPDPDVIFRTSGEMRMSNYLTWQSVYSELFFTEKYWPDITEADIDAIVEQYRSRERRYGFESSPSKTNLIKLAGS